MSKHPVGATWKASNDMGEIEIVLSRRDKLHRMVYEIWEWRFVYPDGIGGGFDWASSYSQARDMALGKLYNGSGKYPRFKRVK